VEAINQAASRVFETRLARPPLDDGAEGLNKAEGCLSAYNSKKALRGNALLRFISSHGHRLSTQLLITIDVKCENLALEIGIRKNRQTTIPGSSAEDATKLTTR
jgi:hypothetical protein